jgi:PAS domain S-box-containing protein
MTRPKTARDLSFLAGGGEMGERIRAFDWARTPVGPVERWPQSLKTAVQIMLTSRYPMFVWWGRELTIFYNDAYIPVPGRRHPSSLGRPAAEVWNDIWDTIGPQAQAVLAEGRASWNEELLLIMERNQFLEETYFTFSYSPVPDDGGGVGGVFCACTEDTQRVLGQRRLRTLRALADQATQAKSPESACAIAAATLAGSPHDLPFTLLYLLDTAGRRATLAGRTGLAPGSPPSPATVELEGGADPWAFRQVAETGRTLEVPDLERKFGPLPGGAWPESPQQALVLPIARPGQTQLAGFVVAGVSPRRPLDDGYRGFLDLLAGQVATAVANARAYEEERKRAEALAVLDRAKTAFFSNVSHEFRTPLTLMLGPIEDLLAGPGDLPSGARAQLELVSRNGLRLLRLVNTLLDFSRIEAGRVQAVYEPTDLATFTEELASVFRAAVERAGLRLLVDCPPLPGPVHVDRDLWEKIVLNLLSNALKFTFAGEIEVTLRPAGDHVELRVRDTGTGIPADELARIFERFHRVHNARGRTHEGTGIGLALVQELVRLHGGSVAVESVPDAGSTFTVRVPLGTAHLPPDRIGADRTLASTATGARPFVEEALRWLPDDDEPAAGAGPDFLPHELLPVSPALQPVQPRVLVADDNADMRHYLLRLLAGRFAVEGVADGAAALEAARERTPDLVLSDVMMPRLDGFGLLKELRADPRTRELPVILLSARAGEESRVEGMEAGADDYLIKPFGARELLARVQSSLDLARVRREAEQALRLRAEQFQALVTLITDVPWTTDAAGAFVAPQPAWEAYTGQTWEQHRGSGWADAVHPDDRDGVRELWRRACETGKPYRSECRLWHARTREYRHIAARGTPLFGADGRVREWVGTCTDVNEQKAIEAAREQVFERERAARAAAESAARMKDEFLATLSHELRTPLSAILGWTQILKLDVRDPGKVRQAVDVLERNGRLQAQLVEDMLDMSRIISGKMRLQVQPMDLLAVIEAAIETLRPAAEAKGLRVQSVLDPRAGDVQGDPARLQQVVWNLLSNAVKFTPPGGSVQVTLTKVGAKVQIRVTDTGEGIPPEFLAHIFERFRQADASFSRIHGGLGIGLALVQQLTELHGGTVKAASEGKGRGATFVIELPIGDPTGPRFSAPAPAGGDLAACEPLGLRGARALLVDDEPDVLGLLQRLLEECAMEVATAASADEALGLVGTRPFDVIVSDIGMPGRDGYELVAELRRRGVQTPALALTAFARPEDRTQAMRSGYQAHVSKPIRPAELLATVASLVNRPRGGQTILPHQKER